MTSTTRTEDRSVPWLIRAERRVGLGPPSETLTNSWLHTESDDLDDEDSGLSYHAMGFVHGAEGGLKPTLPVRRWPFRFLER